MSRLPYVAVAALALAVLPGPAHHQAGGPDQVGRPDPRAVCQSLAAAAAERDGVGVGCVVIGGTPSAEPRGPQPTNLTVDGRPGCGSGPDRPVVATATPVLSAAFTGAPPVEPTFEYQQIGEAASISASTGSATFDFPPGELTPGASYRWRIRGTAFDAAVPGWSDWCEFTVSPAAADFREVADGDVDLVLELGIRPDRRYRVRLTARQQRVLLEALTPDAELIGDTGQPDDRPAAIKALVRRGPGRVTLTGAEWATVITEVAGRASATEQAALEGEAEFEPDAAQYWALVDLLSVRLGGPARLSAGYFG